jgi:chromosome segregation ATPase
MPGNTGQERDMTAEERRAWGEVSLERLANLDLRAQLARQTSESEAWKLRHGQSLKNYEGLQRQRDGLVDDTINLGDSLRKAEAELAKADHFGTERTLDRDHWRTRAEKAEAENAALKDAVYTLQQLDNHAKKENAALKAQLAEQTEALKGLRLAAEEAEKAIATFFHHWKHGGISRDNQFHQQTAYQMRQAEAMLTKALATPEPAKSEEPVVGICSKNVKGRWQCLCPKCAPPTPPEKKVEPFYCCKDQDNPCHPVGDYCSTGRARREEP